MSARRLALTATFTALVAWWSLAGSAEAQVSDPPVVVDAYERARIGQDIEAALGLFAEDATVRVEDRQIRQFTGKDQIRAYLSVQVTHSIPRVTSSQHVVGNTVTWTEHDAVDLSVEAVVRAGKIYSLVYRPAGSSAVSSPVPPVLLGAAAIAALCLAAVGLYALLAPARTRLAAPSRLRGRLLADLDQWQARRA